MASGFTIAGTIIAAVAGIIAIHKFVVRRPRLQLTGEISGVTRYQKQVSGILNLGIENTGFGNAEEVYLEVHTPTWDFPKEEISDEDSILEFDHDSHGYIGASGKRHRFKISDMLHPGSEYKLIHGDIQLEPHRSYHIKYESSSQSHGPRKGSLEILTDYDTVRISHDSPYFWTPYARRILDIGTAIGSIVPFSLTQPQVQIRDEGIVHKAGSFFEWFVTPVVEVETKEESKISAYSITVHGTIWMRKGSSKTAVGSIDLSRCSVPPGDTVVFVMEDQNRRAKQTLACSSEYKVFKQIPLRYTPKEPPYPSFPLSDIEIDWSVEYEVPEKGDQRGIEIQSYQMETNTFGGPTQVKIRGKIRNENAKGRGFFVIGRVYDSSGKLIGTPNRRIQISSDSVTEFNISCYLPIEESKISTCRVVLQRTL